MIDDLYDFLHEKENWKLEMDYSLNQGKFSEFGQLSVSSFQTYHGHLMIPGIYYRYAQQYLNV